MIDEIREEVHRAAGSRQKIAMFHFQILTHAEALEGMNAEGVCRELGVPDSYAIEFQKMIGLARLMRERGVRIVRE